MKPAVIYAAKSTEDKRGSIPDQLVDGRALAKQHGLEVVAEFQDEAASAFHGNRGPGLVAAMAKAEALVQEHGSCSLIVQHSDRLARGSGRKAKHLVTYSLWAMEHDVTILSLQDPGTFMDDEDLGVVMSAIGGMRNHQDSKRKGLAVRDGLRRRVRQRRQFIGGRRLYGYRWAAERDAGGNPVERDGRLVKRLEPDPAEAAIVRRIFNEYLAGVPQRSIAIGLNEDNVATLTGARWYATTIKGMLENSTYKGWVTHSGESFPAVGQDGRSTMEPIVSAEVWERARQQREALSASRGGGRGRTSRGSHVLTKGLLVCRCGAPMSPVTKPTRTPGRLYEVYTCTRRLHHGQAACDQPPIKREAIDTALWSYFADVALDLDATRDSLTSQADQRLGQLDELRRQAQAELARAEARIDRITRGWQDEVIDDAEYKRQRDEVLAERDAARAQADQHERQREAILTAIADFDAEAAMLEELAELRRLVAGEAQAATGEGVESFRLALRRLFTGFELIPLDSPRHFFGTGQLGGQVWQGESHPSLENRGTPYFLLPHVREEAMKPLRDADVDEWPALQRVALALSDNLCARLAAW